ncbi:hypothetical protein CERSUDRAFT_117458 [Gelatoporia subvermispora B]|uniref:Uncharacterized protein n=1 Tax=Ceriporiopsis subvermispora (strain B) TaxID=914234 RepID=M2PDQ2_CERS8|nr:hypothetical protein CERSUDRAFT_117458 [Gelatoporia subvermispora B]
MSSDDHNNVHHSQPIPIHSRRRSESVSESSSESSASPTSPFPTPISGVAPRIGPLSPSTSPILSYIMSQPPKSPTATFPFRRGFGAPVVDDDDVPVETPVTRHARRASTAWAGSERPSQPALIPPQKQDRAAGVLRRLSLGGALARPHIQIPKSPPPSTAAPRVPTPPQHAAAVGAGLNGRKVRRSATMGGGSPPKPRAPSPMGERMLKGHFDGFN